jgi:hypothetical protein
VSLLIVARHTRLCDTHISTKSRLVLEYKVGILHFDVGVYAAADYSSDDLDLDWLIVVLSCCWPHQHLLSYRVALRGSHDSSPPISFHLPTPVPFASPRLGVLVALGLDGVTKGVAIASLPLRTCQRQATSRGTTTLRTCPRQATSLVAMEPQTMGTPPFVTHSRLPAADPSLSPSAPTPIQNCLTAVTQYWPSFSGSSP